MTDQPSTIDHLLDVGAHTAERQTYDEAGAREWLGMDGEMFRRAWPAFFVTVAHITIGGPDPPPIGFQPKRPQPGAMALLFPVGPDTTRPHAAVLRDPWEIVALDDAKFVRHLDRIESAGAAFNRELAAWSRARYGRVIPDSMREAGVRYRDAFIALSRLVLHTAGRKLQFAKPVLAARLNIAIEDEVYLAHIRSSLLLMDATRQRGKEAFWHSEDAQDATIKRFATIGEAAKKLSPGFKSSHPFIDWKDLAGLRDVLNHNLEGGPNLAVLWQRCEYEVPVLLATLQLI